mmetsp:Transcript_14607/g.16786  ORF Transcript_14607/g.16786 Transcript_14607/m.16786 type:complete len:248 (+) Transcript_14607:22-765(+)|eukprot:CAMPEP_0176467600 /NCGR_PEP_ID=MMETSP0127-20121128/38552_1 /TAXON_ID=938130 /ORGANISM="Platyophrya macrostoma, Strain WH" /LENGTH=247 /DNA_ID=CAMNT_0017860925 /DNA_START=22 /DNA_END=765 /DNA_ORIENTATION=-
MNIRGLGDFKKDDKGPKPDKKNADTYAGGEKSGLAIEHPEDVDAIVRKAEENAKKNQAKGNAGKPVTNLKITLFKNGYMIDDKDFFDYNTPEGKAFMTELNQGRVPQSLANKYPDGLDVGLEDRRSENYEKPPPPKYVEFSGSGTALSKTTAKAISGSNPELADKPKIDPSKPTTTVRIKFHDGKTVNLEVNMDTKVFVLFDYVLSAAPVDGDFKLIAGFPPKPITAVDKTIEEAELEGSTITQTLG